MQRQRSLVQGIVQGVGFRPFVYNLALRWRLVGFVLNNSAGVTIEVEGTPEALDGFQRALREEKPPLARIDTVVTDLIPLCHDAGFTIMHSESGSERQALISPDTAMCQDCLSELFDPQDRRYGYPFINCTNCGPRFTIVQDVPYDRDKTTMRIFPQCSSCQREYNDPRNRRFHAQPNACPVCGPQVRLIDWSASSLSLEEEPEPIENAARCLAEGAILAIKGLGGYHLACDACNVEAVQRLRQRKYREAKPFALMVPDLATARQLCHISEAEAALLQSQRRPIVLLQRCARNFVAPAVAPLYETLGIMLPYTPLHALLLAAFAEASDHPAVLVMTSGNMSDEPIAYRDDDARQRLHSIADGTVTHNRDIYMRCDDSVMRVVAGGEQFFRRSRGYAPEPIPLPFDLPLPLLACGGHLKNTFCLGKGRQAFVSHHIGDLENLETLTSFREGIEHFQRLFDITPQAVAYDLHPEYLATKYALDTSSIPRKIGVQHHHAHIASVLAEHGLQGPVIGVAADGTGWGTDGAIWGCEIMVADLRDFERAAHLAYVPLPGGEQAIHQPWRMAATYLAQVYGDDFLALDIPFVQQLERTKWRLLAQMMERGINSPLTSSLGRLFDAVAALLGIRRQVVYEGQAAIEMEVLAETDDVDSYPFAIHSGSKPALLDVAPLIRAIVNDLQQKIPISRIAGRFHCSLAEMFVQACMQVGAQTGLRVVTLSGGVFQNRLLLELLVARLKVLGLQVYINRRVPPNDGGISLGQLAIAASRLRDDC
ncbi:carbamoyltransferase [Reticulibacter mediterranei]|uniref:Carbamoyltransferase n=1 Tax=Reticulibacter mediterranei TaxID=2778369 RepID=A0A8J3N3P7_9CHLR|nr:carbamoyltransferase HypF [Reticulibacter mediterranei]GHO97344.1 carbamoyltransferase [Reticulibacter mediterranei]